MLMQIKAEKQKSPARLLADSKIDQRRLAAFTLPTNSISVAVWCEHCERWHRHGRGGHSADAQDFGYRVPLCQDARGGDVHLLINRGVADDLILVDLKRRRPLGPDVLAEMRAQERPRVHEFFANAFLRVA